MADRSVALTTDRAASQGDGVKRLCDLVVAAAGLILLSPALAALALAVWVGDFRSPLYVARRVGRNGSPFNMVKLRSMRVGADRIGVDSTSDDDVRVTRVGRFLRAYKLDELLQLWNVLVGDMSLVGPRPQVEREVIGYTEQERELLAVRPGVTDFASIVFADEGEILRGQPDPDLAYNQLIRPWKSRLGLLYVRNPSLWVDLRLILLTALALGSRRRALATLNGLLRSLGADEITVRAAAREQPLMPYPPPGSTGVVTSR